MITVNNKLIITHDGIAKIFVSLSIIFFVAAGCNTAEAPQKIAIDSVATNIKMYSHVWDEIINKGKLDLFNGSSFTASILMHASPSDVVGIDSARAYYANFITGFTNISFTIKDIFGQGNKLIKYWNFKGAHTGVFFGYHPLIKA